MRIIGDGDSLVMATLQQSVVYGPFIQKIECANHACKGYRSRLEKLAADHLEFRGRGGLTKRAMQRLTVGAHVAIRMHSKTGIYNSLGMTSETVQTMCLVTTVNATLHFVSLD